MTDDTEKTRSESKEREKMPQGLPRKKSNRLWEWQRYVKKETQRLMKNKDSKVSEEITKPPLPKGPGKRDKQKSDNSKSLVEKQPGKITSKELEDIETQSEFDRDLDILLSDPGVELDDTLKDWVEPARKKDVKKAANAKSAVAEKPKTKTKQKKEEKTRSETLELFNEELEKTRRKKRNPRRTREHLIENLLDPVITLDEAAVILNVCKTTVRRYTNAGKLECLRTPGNQRRFRLSTVLEFLEEKEGRKASQDLDSRKD